MNLPEQWLDRFERSLLLILSGFLFWGNAVSSIALLLLISVSLLRKGKAVFTKELSAFWMIFPIAFVTLLWARGGFALSGSSEVQLWLTWMASMIYFHHCAFKDWFQRSFIYVSAVQAFVVMTFLYGTSGATIADLGSSQFVRDLLGARFGVHPTYMTAIWLWAALLAVRMKQNTLLNGIAALMLIVAGTTTGGKMPLIAFLIVLPVFIFLRSKMQGYHKLFGFAAFGFFIALILSGPIIVQRFQELQQLNTTSTADKWLNSTELRLAVWRCSLSSFVDHVFTGVGIGNTRPVLDECYEGYQNEQFFETEFNTHNQFAHYALAGGILAGLFFLIWWFGLTYRFFRANPSSALAWFMLYASILMLTENYLLRQHGMMFISFMLFTLLPKESAVTTNEQHDAS